MINNTETPGKDLRRSSGIKRSENEESNLYNAKSINQMSTPLKYHPDTGIKEEVRKQINFGGSSSDSDNKENKTVSKSDLFNKIWWIDTPFDANNSNTMGDQNITKIMASAMNTSDTKFWTDLKRVIEGNHSKNTSKQNKINSKKMTQESPVIKDLKVPEFTAFKDKISEIYEVQSWCKCDSKGSKFAELSKKIKFDIFQEQEEQEDREEEENQEDSEKIESKKKKYNYFNIQYDQNTPKQLTQSIDSEDERISRKRMSKRFSESEENEFDYQIQGNLDSLFPPNQSKDLIISDKPSIDNLSQSSFKHKK